MMLLCIVTKRRLNYVVYFHEVFNISHKDSKEHSLSDAHKVSSVSFGSDVICPQEAWIAGVTGSWYRLI